MYERTYKIKIYDSSGIIYIKGKEVRTPTQAVVSESELKVIKTSLASFGCKNFVVEEIIEPFLYNFQEVCNTEVIIPLEKKVVPTYDEVKAKLSSKIKVSPRLDRTRQRGAAFSILENKFKTETSRTSFYVPLELQANRNLFKSQVPVEKEDFEVKIEYLKIESDSILKKLVKESVR